MFSKLEGHFSFCASKRKVPGEGLKNSDGIPPSHKAMEVRVGEVGKNRCHLSQVRLGDADQCETLGRIAIEIGRRYRETVS